MNEIKKLSGGIFDEEYLERIHQDMNVRGLISKVNELVDAINSLESPVMPQISSTARENSPRVLVVEVGEKVAAQKAGALCRKVVEAVHSTPGLEDTVVLGVQKGVSDIKEVSGTDVILRVDGEELTAEEIVSLVKSKK